jgi:hypothetical protein
VWHASVSLLVNGQPSLILYGTRTERRLAQSLAIRLIEGVGGGRTLEQTKEVACHARRALSEAELRQIDQQWLTIPAIDPGDDPRLKVP